ncbi:MAG TPA: hypothetical protein VHW24_01565 [Bryobacteraceae bacterium]|nr:hypothetical protein [Bryobacteraceae bacterium]
MAQAAIAAVSNAAGAETKNLTSEYHDGHAEEERATGIAVVRERTAESAGHPFYSRLNEILDKAGFDPFSERSVQVSVM